MEFQQTPIMVNRTEIRPLCYLIRVDEPEFGCEGRPDGEPVYGTVLLCDAHGERTVRIAETVHLRPRLDDKMILGETDGQLVLIPRTQTAYYLCSAEECAWWESVK